MKDRGTLFALSLLLGAVLMGCALLPAALPDLPFIRAATETPLPEPGPSPFPTDTPAPPRALPPDTIWVAAAGQGTSVASVAPDGAVTLVRVPLNEGQTASDILATRDGRWLTYLVWNPDGTQRGVAAWELSEANAKLVGIPEPGYRIVSIAITDRADSVLVVSVQVDAPVDEAPWRLERMPLAGGEAELLLDDSELILPYPPLPFAWAVDGPLLVNVAAPNGGSAGIVAIDPATGFNATVFLPEAGGRVLAPSLSPDSARIVFLDLQPDLLPDGYGLTLPSNVAVIRDVRLEVSMTVTPPEGDAIFGAHWLPDGQRLLLDVVRLGADGESFAGQYWTIVRPGSAEAWTPYDQGPGRAALFDAAPLGPGVAYTTSGEDPWALIILPNLAAGSPPVIVPLGLIAAPGSAPVIVRVP